MNEKKIADLFMAITIASYLYSVFVPLNLGTPWIYIGLEGYLVGVMFGSMAQLDFARPPVDELATTRAYRVS